MPARKVTDTAGAEPRRSGRLASQPVPPPAEAKPKAPRAPKKRSAEALGETKDAESSASKKVGVLLFCWELGFHHCCFSLNFCQAKADEKAEAAEDKEPASPALAKLEIGDSLPTLILKNEKAEDVQIAELAAEKGVILFLVPKADTRMYFRCFSQVDNGISTSAAGCTNQACGFRDSYPDFSSSNFAVYCLSADSPTAQSKWQKKVSDTTKLCKLTQANGDLTMFAERASISTNFRSQEGIDHCPGCWRGRKD